MGFFIECCGGAEIVHAGKTVKISAAQIKQVVNETTQVSASAYKGADEGRRATFAATTAQGEFIWHVFFSTGDSGDSIDEVAMVRAPSGVDVKSDPAFEIQDSDS